MSQPVVHFEIHGPDREQLEKYYAELFGWKTQPIPGSGYALVDTQAGSGINGGLATSQDGQPRQIFYVGVPDVASALAKANSLGATTTLDTSVVPGGPTIAIFADKAGNPIGLVQGAEDEDPSRPSPGSGRDLSWFEINGGDFAEQTKFYTDLFGWSFGISETPAFSYAQVENVPEGGCPGAISVTPSGLTGITLWAQVDDPQAYLDRAAELGGSIDMKPAPVDEHLSVGTFIDPAGNRLGVYHYKT